MRQWPVTNIGQIFAFIIESKAFETEYIGQYKLKKAYSYFGSGFVGKLFSKKMNDYIMIRSSVSPSQHIREKSHQLWILFNVDGSICTAFCTCTAGQSNCCNHVAAVLYKIEYANTKDITNPICTDNICSWNAPSKEIQPSMVKDMNFVKHKSGKLQKNLLIYKEKNDFDPRPVEMREITEVEKKQFLLNIKEVLPNAALNIMFTPPPDNDVPLPITEIASAARSCFPTELSCVTDRFLGMLTFNDNQLQELEKATRNQSHSNQWWEQRRGRITSSCFYSIHQKVTSLLRSHDKDVKCKVAPLLKAIVDPVELKNVAPLNWGKENEKNAAKIFMSTEGVRHQNPKLITCGLFVHKPHPYLGASPDNIFQCRCCLKSCVEYKCPFSIRDEDISVSWKKTDFLEMVDGKVVLKRNHKYYTQIIGQMAITGYKSTYFVVYTKKDVLVNKITFDEEHWQKVLPSLILFFKTYVQRYLLGFMQLYTCPLCDKPCLNENEFKNKEDNSIDCDICGLWFHWDCCGLVQRTVLKDRFICIFCQ
nr:uncharacterized protein LOC124809022 [Hydra vulgaris]